MWPSALLIKSVITRGFSSEVFRTSSQIHFVRKFLEGSVIPQFFETLVLRFYPRSVLLLGSAARCPGRMFVYLLFTNLSILEETKSIYFLSSIWWVQSIVWLSVELLSELIFLSYWWGVVAFLICGQ